MTTVHQVVPVLERADAVGDEVKAIRDALRGHGFVSEIFAPMIRSGDEADVRPFDALFESGDVDAVIYHMAIASSAADRLAGSDLPLILIHHNVTPPSFFEGIDRAHFDGCRQALEQLARMRDRTELALGDSQHNRLQLQDLGYTRTGVLPLLVDQEPFHSHRGGPMLAAIRERPTLLMVGRVAPNKCLEDGIRLLHAYRRGVDAEARLWIVGDSSRLERYAQGLRALATTLGESDHVRLLGRATRQELLDCYHGAFAYVSMSAHEGFGVPLLEAMTCGLPVVAYDSTAVGETLGGCGLTLGWKDFPLLAEMLAALRPPSALRARLVACGRERARTLSAEVVVAQLLEHLAGIGLHAPVR